MLTNETPWGYIYTSTSLMDGGDLFDPTVHIAYLDPSIPISRILYKCGVLERTPEHSREYKTNLEKSCKL